jgi:hypothetical protein
VKATIPYIEQKFEEFNCQMFGGKLPKIPVELSDAKLEDTSAHGPLFLGVMNEIKRTFGRKWWNM